MARAVELAGAGSRLSAYLDPTPFCRFFRTVMPGVELDVASGFFLRDADAVVVAGAD